LGFEEVTAPGTGFAWPQVPPFALHHEALKAALDIVVDLIELLRGISGAEVARPSAEHGIDGTPRASSATHAEATKGRGQSTPGMNRYGTFFM
jgi:hypothetical protein